VLWVASTRLRRESLAVGCGPEGTQIALDDFFAQLGDIPAAARAGEAPGRTAGAAAGEATRGQGERDGRSSRPGCPQRVS